MSNSSNVGKLIKTVCAFCAQNGVGLDVYVKDGRIVEVRGTADNPLNRGATCAKVRALPQWVHHPNRLTYPIIKSGSEWRRITWDQALDTIAEKLMEVADRHGTGSLAVYRGFPWHARSDFDNSMRLFCNLFGTPNFFAGSSICSATTVIGISTVLGGRADPDIQNSKCIVVCGGNPSEAMPCTGGRQILEAKRRGAKLIVIDPRRTFLGKRADIYAQIRPGTDCALALGLMNVIISEGLYEKDFVEKWTVGFERLVEHVKDYPPERVARITWVPEERIREIARTYASTKPACIVHCHALEGHMNSCQTIRSMAMLYALTGNVDVKGGNVLADRARLGLDELRLPKETKDKPLGADLYPLFYKFYRLGQAMPLPEVILSEKPYPVKAMIILAANPAQSWPNTQKVRRALESLEFLVVMDLFLTETARLADIVLPAATFAERTEVTDLCHGMSCLGVPKVMARRQAVEPPGECRSDWEFLIGLARRMGYGEYFPWKDIREMLDFHLKPLGVTFEELEKSPAGISYASRRYRKYEDGGFKTPSGKVEFYSRMLEEHGYDPMPVHRESPETPSSTPRLAEKYPLILTTGIRMEEYEHTQLRQIDKLRMRRPEPLAEINEETAKKHHVKDGDMITVETLRGKIRVKAKVTRDIAPQVVALQHGWSEANENILTNDAFRDPISGFPELRALLCRISL